METLNPTNDDANIGYSILMRSSDATREVDLEIRKLITVICGVFRDHKSPPTPVAYFSATCSSLDLIAASKHRPSDNVIHAHFTVLSILIPKVPAAFLADNLQSVCNSLAPALSSDGSGSGLFRNFERAICTGVKCIAQMLIIIAKLVNDWSQVSKPFSFLLSFGYVRHSIELRGHTGSCVHDALQSFQGTPLLGPASKEINDLLMNKYPLPIDDVVGPQVTKPIHTLILVKECLGAMSSEDRAAVLVYFKDLLERHDTYVTKLIADALYKLCLKPSLPAGVSLELLLELMSSICLSVSQHKTNSSSVKSIAGLLNLGVPKVYSQNKQMMEDKLLIVFDAVIVLLEQSVLQNFHEAGNALLSIIAYIDESLIILLHANRDVGSQSEPTLIEKLIATFQKLFSYHCSELWYLVLEIVSTMFDKLGVYSSVLMRDMVKTLADVQKSPDKGFFFEEEVKLLLEIVVQKCGFDAITAVIPQELLELLTEINEQLGSKSVEVSSHVSNATIFGNHLSQSKSRNSNSVEQCNHSKRKVDDRESKCSRQRRALLAKRAKLKAKGAIHEGLTGAVRMTKKLKL